MAEIAAHHGLLKNTHLHVDDTGGSGRPVVLIHGWPLSGEAWNLQVPALVEAGYRVVTYDRRGFGRSEKPLTGYNYDTLATDLHTLLVELDLHDTTVLGFSMGGGEVARYFSHFGSERLRSVVFAAAVPPFMLHTDDNPDGPLPAEVAAGMAAALTADESGFYDGFMTAFFSAGGVLAVTPEQRQEAVALTRQADLTASLGCMDAFANTDFRQDVLKVNVPALILHGDSDATVPLEGSGQRTHDMIPGSELHVIAGGPHGFNVSHATEFNAALITFLAK